MTPDAHPEASPDPTDPAAGGHVDAREVDVVDLADVPADEIISRSILVLMEAAAEKLGMTAEEPLESPHFDLDEARKLITALAGLVDGAAEWIGPKASYVRGGLQGLQHTFRESSAHPDAPGEGPGEKYTGPVY